MSERFNPKEMFSVARKNIAASSTKLRERASSAVANLAESKLVKNGTLFSVTRNILGAVALANSIGADKVQEANAAKQYDVQPTASSHVVNFEGTNINATIEPIVGGATSYVITTNDAGKLVQAQDIAKSMGSSLVELPARTIEENSVKTYAFVPPPAEKIVPTVAVDTQQIADQQEVRANNAQFAKIYKEQASKLSGQASETMRSMSSKAVASLPYAISGLLLGTIATFAAAGTLASKDKRAKENGKPSNRLNSLGTTINLVEQKGWKVAGNIITSVYDKVIDLSDRASIATSPILARIHNMYARNTNNLQEKTREGYATLIKSTKKRLSPVADFTVQSLKDAKSVSDLVSFRRKEDTDSALHYANTILNKIVGPLDTAVNRMSSDTQNLYSAIRNTSRVKIVEPIIDWYTIKPNNSVIPVEQFINPQQQIIIKRVAVGANVIGPDLSVAQIKTVLESDIKNHFTIRGELITAQQTAQLKQLIDKGYNKSIIKHFIEKSFKFDAELMGAIAAQIKESITTPKDIADVPRTSVVRDNDSMRELTYLIGQSVDSNRLNAIIEGTLYSDGSTPINSTDVNLKIPVITADLMSGQVTNPDFFAAAVAGEIYSDGAVPKAPTEQAKKSIEDVPKAELLTHPSVI
jgi:hypothetical protein